MPHPRDRPRTTRALTVRAAAVAASALLGLPQPALAAPASRSEAMPPSQFGVDAPQLARLGSYAVGVKQLRLQQAAQADVLKFDTASGQAPRVTRLLAVDVWYPAAPLADASPARRGAAPRAVYSAQLPSVPPLPPAAFTVTGMAMRGAAPVVGGGFPLVVVSHGYSGDPATLIWLTENLASKGYVVAAIHHDDPPITDRSGFVELLLRRPLDIAFVTATLQRTLGRDGLIDPSLTALVGYSMGGYGVLTAAGATLDPGGAPAQLIPGGLLLPYLRGAAQADELKVGNLKAVVAISPAGGGPLAAWGREGLRSITSPLLLIQGDHDRTVDYATGARADFEGAVQAPRYLLTLLGAGHSIGFIPAPAVMRHRLWDLDWFQDPVWRTERVNAVNAHFITAFLDRYVKGDASRAEYLDVPVPRSSDGAWPQRPGAVAPAYDAYAPGGPEITLWKGFQRSEASGLELLRAAAGEPAPAPASASKPVP